MCAPTRWYRERWSRIQHIFHGALEKDAGDRAEYVSRECAGNEDVRKAVEALLESDDQTSPVDLPAVALRSEEILGHYRLSSKLGEGGMGVVYLARDLRLDRAVAIKVLRAEFKENGRRRRMLAEAKAASALNHPNIITVHDVGSEDDRDYLVMEYVPGKPLEQLIPHNGLKLKEALLYAIQIAEALACAHRVGIIHRDLKPANVLITDSCVAKVVDFGIAKRVRAEQDTGTLTERGLIFGSVAYMSPEQAEGKPVDARSDIFSFGSLLYEMVTGRRAFQRDTAASTIAAVLHDEPVPPLQIAEDMSPELVRLIERCLRKNPAERFQRMDDAKAALERIRQPARRDRRRLFSPAKAAVVVLMIAAIGLAAAALKYVKTSPPEAVLTPVPLTTYPGFESGPTFSPDGDQVAFSWCKHEASPEWLNVYPNICNIYVKQIGMEPPSRLTDGMTKDISPAWSPDGRWIAFLRVLSTTRLALVVVPQRGGRERILQEFDAPGTPDVPRGPHLAWTPDSQWIICPTPEREKWGLSLVAINSAARRTLSKPWDVGAVADTSPSISTDGRTLVFSRNIKADIYDLYKLRLSSQYTPEGEPVALGAQDREAFGPALSSNGSEVLFASKWRGERGLWRFSTSGAGAPQRLSFAPSFASEPAVSRRGQRLAYTDYREDSNIWKVDLSGRNREAGAPVRVISSTRVDDSPAPSPDGTRLAFVSNRTGAREVWVCERDGSHLQQLTSFGGPWIHAPRWSPDGQIISVTIAEVGQDQKLGLINVSTGAVRALSIPGFVKWPTWSPDGHWLYFALEAPPSHSIWKVRPAGGAPVQLTKGAGEDMPQPSLDGKFIYYSKGWPGPMSIYRMPVEGGDGTKIVEGVTYGGLWTVGSDALYFFATPDSEGRSELRMYEFATRRLKTILTAEHALTCKVAASPGDRTIYYAEIDEHGSDLMLVENFR